MRGRGEERAMRRRGEERAMRRRGEERAMRRRRLAAGVIAGGLATALLVACSGKVTEQGGLEVIFETNLTMPTDFNQLAVAVRQQVADGGWGTPLLDTQFPMPAQSALPKTLSIAAGSSPDQVVLIHVAALHGGASVVTREIEIQVPTDRVAALRVLLSSLCEYVTCGARLTCDPTKPGTPPCVPFEVPSVQLPDYQPTDLALDGSLPRPDATIDPGSDGSPARDSGQGSGPDSGPNAGGDGGGVDAGEQGGGVDARADGAGVDAGIDAGLACTSGTARCSGDAVQTCTGGTWRPAVPCDGGFCNGAGVCGSCTPGAQRCVGNGVATCEATGIYGAATACSGQACVAGACVGTCSPGATRSCSGGANNCPGGTETCGAAGTWGSCTGAAMVCECSAGQTVACSSLSGVGACGIATCSGGRWVTTGCSAAQIYCNDLDGDGFCSTICTGYTCSAPAKTRANCPETDCNDNDPTINPNSPEDCTSKTSCVKEAIVSNGGTCSCTSTGVPTTNACGTYSTCMNGQCVCNQGMSCSTKPCYAGTVSCLSSPTCIEAPSDPGTPCSGPGTCDGNGSCFTNCVPGTPRCVPPSGCVSGSSTLNCDQGSLCAVSYVAAGQPCIAPPNLTCNAQHQCQ